MKSITTKYTEKAPPVRFAAFAASWLLR